MFGALPCRRDALQWLEALRESVESLKMIRDSATITVDEAVGKFDTSMKACGGTN